MARQLPFKISPQLRFLTPGLELPVPLGKVDTNARIVVKKMSIVTFSEQGDQDLLILFRLGQRTIYKSGLLKVSGSLPIDVPIPAIETRLNSAIGGLYNRLSSVLSSGYPDNYPSGDLDLNSIAESNEVLYFSIKNQSGVYTHSVMVEIEGIIITR